MLAMDARFHILPEETSYYPAKLARLARAHFPEYSPKRRKPYRPMALLCDGGDIFHENVPASFIRQVFEMARRRPEITWQVLTKRIARAKEVLFGEGGDFYLVPGEHIPNIWLMTTAENQAYADQRIPLLLHMWSGICGISVEPMLEPLNLVPYLRIPNKQAFVIVGAESGLERRPFSVRWAMSLLTQCREAGVAFHGKQDSAPYPGRPLLLNGEEVKEWPQDLGPATSLRQGNLL